MRSHGTQQEGIKIEKTKGWGILSHMGQQHGIKILENKGWNIIYV
jgi:hypothetical protein